MDRSIPGDSQIHLPLCRQLQEAAEPGYRAGMIVVPYPTSQSGHLACGLNEEQEIVGIDIRGKRVEPWPLERRIVRGFRVSR